MPIDFMAAAIGKKEKPKADMPTQVSKNRSLSVLDSVVSKFKAIFVPELIDNVAKELKATFMPQLDELEKKAEAVVIKDDETRRQAIEMQANIKRFLRAFDDRRKEVSEDPRIYVAGINSKVCKPFSDKGSRILAGLKKKDTDYIWQVELARRKKEKELKEEAERLQKQAEEEAKAAGVEAPTVAPPPVIKKETVIRTESGASSHLRTKWKMTKILNYDEVPLEYKIFDLQNDKEREMFEKKINRFVEAGTRNIPGLKIEEVPSSTLRT